MGYMCIMDIKGCCNGFVDGYKGVNGQLWVLLVSEVFEGILVIVWLQIGLELNLIIYQF